MFLFGPCVFFPFIFLVPFIPMEIIPCQHYGAGYASLSYYLFNLGQTFLNGKFYWMTQGYAGCV